MFNIGDRVYIWDGHVIDMGEVGLPTETHVMIRSKLENKTAVYELSKVYYIGTGPIMTNPEVPFETTETVQDSDINWCKQVRDQVDRGNRILKIMAKHHVKNKK